MNEKYLSPRIVKHCLPVWNDGHYKHATHEAMIQVEQALKEKGLIQKGSNIFGHTLISNLFGSGDKVKTTRLRVPLGEELQQQAEKYFQGVFSYYRNYIAHDGSQIDERIGFRVMIIASELLDLIDASSLSFSDIGGVKGLISIGEFASEQQIVDVLQYLEPQFLPDGIVDGLFEELLEKFGFGDRQLGALFELDLIRYFEDDYVPSTEERQEVWNRFSPPDTLAHFEITDLGWEFIKKIQGQT